MVFNYGLCTEKKSRLTGRVKEGRKGLPLPVTGDEKGAFVPCNSNTYAKLEFMIVNI
jgi:hypothetical protein